MARRVAEGRLTLQAPRWARDLPRKGDTVTTVQFASLPPEVELRRIGAFIERYPQVGIRAYGGYDGSIRDTEFLRFFPRARHVSVDALYELESLDGLRYLSNDLESLGLGRTRRRLSIEELPRFASLRRLFLEGFDKGIEVLGHLRELRALTLRSITLPDLAVLAPLGKLRSLDIKLGGSANLSGLGEMKQLEYLELWMIRGLSDLSQVAGLESLRYLFLQALKHVSALPDLSRCARLERIHLETMKGLTDLSALRTAPALTDLSLVDMPQLRWAHVEALQAHPTLQRLNLGTGSSRRNAEFSERLAYAEIAPPGADLRRIQRGDIE